MAELKNKIYIAGSLFKEADIVQRKREASMLKTENLEIYNPIEAPFNDKNLLPTAKSIVDGDFKEIKESNMILVAIDDIDMGLATEVGIVYGINHLRKQLKNLVDSKNINLKNIEQLLNEYPEKKIFAHHTDIRLNTAHHYRGNYIPYGANQFFIGAIEQYGKIYSSSIEAIEDVKKNII